MKILLLGAQGRLGKALARSLASLGDIVACGRPPALGKGVSTACHASWVDLERPSELRQVVRYIRPDLIVNAAAYTAVETAESDPQRAMAVNGAAPGTLAEEAGRLGAALVHYSTDYVFDGQGDSPWREDDAAGPLNVYGRTKLAGEEAIRAAGASHLIIRTSWLYAVSGTSFATKMLVHASRNSAFDMVADQIGAPTSVRFVADTTAHILAQAAGNPASLFRTRGGTLHVVCTGQTSWFAFAKHIFALAHELNLPCSSPTIRPIATAVRTNRVQRPLNSRLDTGRLRERFSIVPPAWDVEFRAHFERLYAEHALAGAAKTSASGFAR